MSQRADELVITGVGVASAGAYGLEAHWELLRQGAVKANAAAYSMGDFKAAGHLKEPRLLKAVSATDAIGLAALADLQRTGAWSADAYPAPRSGLYTGSPGPSSFDLCPYFEAMEAARDGDGHIDVGAFGRTAMSARPTTLLASLANHVLCYGSMMFNAQGPNSNYTSGELSGHLAVQQAAKRLRRQQLDYVVAGGFGAHSEAIDTGMYTSLGLLLAQGSESTHTVMPYEAGEDARGGMVLADGAAFVALERRGAATARGAKILATYVGGGIASDGLGPLRSDPEGVAYSRMILRTLTQAGIEPAQIALIFANASGICAVDRCEISALQRVFGGLGAAFEPPALGVTTRVFGNLMEASGILELGLVPRLFAHGELPAVMTAPTSLGFSNRLPRRTPAASYALVLKASPWGEYSCIVLRREDQ